MVDEVLNLGNDSLSILLGYFFRGAKEQPFHYSPSTMPPLSQLICAYCRVSSLEVGFEGVESHGNEGDKGKDYDSGDEEGIYAEFDEESSYSDEGVGSSYGGVESNCHEGCERYSIRANAESSLLGMIDLNAEWRKAQPARLDFVEIERVSRRLVYAILVEWQDGIAYRVQRPVAHLRLRTRLWGTRCHVLHDKRRDVLVTFG